MAEAPCLEQHFYFLNKNLHGLHVHRMILRPPLKPARLTTSFFHSGTTSPNPSLHGIICRVIWLGTARIPSVWGVGGTVRE